MRRSTRQSYPTFELVIVDAELFALNGDGDRGWPLLCRRVLPMANAASRSGS
jgi:hypothetical protein